MDAELDLGSPMSYLTAERGLAVYSSQDEPVGTVTHVLADEGEDVFDGVVIDSSVGLGGARFVDADDIDEFFDRGVRLKLSTAQCAQLHRPEAAPATIEAHADQPPPSHLSRKLHRAWDVISGKS